MLEYLNKLDIIFKCFSQQQFNFLQISVDNYQGYHMPKLVNNFGDGEVNGGPVFRHYFFWLYLEGFFLAGFRVLYGVLRIKTSSAMCRANTLPTLYRSSLHTGCFLSCYVKTNFINICDCENRFMVLALIFVNI